MNSPTVTLDVYPGGFLRRGRLEVVCREHGRLLRTRDQKRALHEYLDHVEEHPHYHLLVATDKRKKRDAYDGPYASLEEARDALSSWVDRLEREGLILQARYEWQDKLTPLEGSEAHLRSGSGEVKIVRAVPCLRCSS